MWQCGAEKKALIMSGFHVLARLVSYRPRYKRPVLWACEGECMNALLLCSTEKTAAHAQRLARAGVIPLEPQHPARQSHDMPSVPAPAKRAARDIPTGPRGKRERRMMHPAFGLDCSNEQV